MYKLSEYKTVSDVATYIGKTVKKHLGYQTLKGNILPGLDEVRFLIFERNGKENGYLNLYIMPNGDEWKVSAIGAIVEQSCYSSLTEEESDRLWRFGTAYTHGAFSISMCDISGVDLDTVCSYVNNTPLDKVVVTASVVAKRKSVSQILYDWFEIQSAIKNGEFDADETAKQDMLQKNLRTEVVEKIVNFCKEAKNCINSHIGWQGAGMDTKAKVSLLSRDKQVYELYLCVDEIHAGIFYLSIENGVWVKKLIPDIIGDICSLFSVKSR